MSTPSEVARDLVALFTTTEQQIHEATKKWGAELQAEVQRKASGRPGPNAPTGDYRRSINRRTEKRADGSAVEVGTNKPQGRRLEFGFVGTDSLGRSYDQPAYPHFGPALDAIAPKYEATIAAIVKPPAGRQATRRRNTKGGLA